MKKTVFAALATATAFTAIAGAASAQPYGGYEQRDYRYDYREERQEDRWERRNINQRQMEIARRIEAGQRRGALTRNEATSLGNEARNIARLEARYRYNGLSGWERADLDRRLDRLEGRLWQQARDDDRTYRYGQGYGYRR